MLPASLRSSAPRRAMLTLAMLTMAASASAQPSSIVTSLQASATQAMPQIASTIAAAQSRIADLTNQVSDQRKQAAALQAQRAAEQHRLDSLANEFRRLKARADASTQALEDKLKRIQEEIDQLKTQLAKLETMIQKIENEFAKLEAQKSKELDRLSEQKASLTFVTSISRDATVAAKLIDAVRRNDASALENMLGAARTRIEFARATDATLQFDFSIGATRQCLSVTPLCRNGSATYAITP